MKTSSEVHEFMTSVISNIPFGLIAIDMEGIITMVNKQAVDNLNFNYKANQLINTLLKDSLEPKSKLYKKIFSCLNRDRKSFNFEALSYCNKSLKIQGRKILNGMIITILDVTKAKENQLLATQSLLERQESERRRLSQEIHDSLGPLLSTIRLNIESINSKQDLDKETHIRLAKVEELVQEATQDMRDISHALMPSAIIDFGLTKALENLCRKLDDSHTIKIEFISNEMKTRLEQNIELGLYRISQELLNNALKYSKAKKIDLQLICHSHHLVLTMEDNGVGFDLKAVKEKTDNGIGLKNIETRVSILNGTFDLETSAGNGVLATIKIPIKIETINKP